MCGIAGIYKFKEGLVEVSDLKKLTVVIQHRGPDGDGHWVSRNKTVGFGHRRLSIIDLSGNAAQPMQFADGRYTITFNGEIYNYLELREDLQKKGYFFKTESDTEVILALFDLKRENCLTDLDGMFAFAIWDELERTLFCARDRFGEKPFHYYVDGEQFVFASEIKQFWQLGVRKHITEEKQAKYLQTGEVDDPNNPLETFYEKIFRLDASHYILLKQGITQVIQARYWKIDLDKPRFSGSIDEAAQRFYDLFVDSVNLRLRSDVPVGSSLSGGLDSSAIVTIIDLLRKDNYQQNTFSARFKNFEKDEGRFIEEITRSRQINVHYTWPDQDYLAAVLDKVCFHQDEPFGSASIVAQYAVMQLAKENRVTVLLDGQGADEYLAGYLRYYKVFLDSVFFNKRGKYDRELTAYNKIHINAAQQNYEETESFRMKVGRLRRKMMGMKSPHPMERLSQTLQYDTTVFGLKTLLRYADRNSMAHSREVRLPFLSHQLVEFVFTLPDEFKLFEGWTKYILRYAMRDHLPSEICWRKDKVGYEPPQSRWLDTAEFSEKITSSKKKYQHLLPKREEKGYTNSYSWNLLMAHKFFD